MGWVIQITDTQTQAGHSVQQQREDGAERIYSTSNCEMLLCSEEMNVFVT